MKSRLTLGLLVLLAFALRFWGSGWGMPYRLHPDAGKYVQPAAQFSTGDFNPHYFENPSGFTYPLWLWLSTIHITAQTMGIVDSYPNLSERYTHEPWRLELWGRWFVVLLGTGSTLLMFSLAKYFLSRRGAMLATLLFAGCFVHVRQSRFAVNDVPMLAVLMAATLFTARLWAKGQWRDLIGAALLAGYATGTKYTACVAVPAILPVLFWPKDPELCNQQPNSVAAHPWRAAMALIPLCTAGFLLACPYAVLDFSSFFDALKGLAGGRIQRWEGQDATPVALLVIQTFQFGVGLGPIAVCLVALWRERKTLQINWRTLAPLTAGPLTLILLASQPLFFARFALPLLPFFALLTGWAGDRLITANESPCGPAPGRCLAMAALIVALIGGESLARSTWHGWLCTNTDTRVLAVEYLYERISPFDEVAADHLALPFRYRDVVVPPAPIPYLDIGLDLSLIDPVQLQVNGFDWAAFSSFAINVLIQEKGPELARAWQERLIAVATLEHTITAGQDVPFHLEHAHTPFIGLWRTERPGPDIYIYRFNSLPVEKTEPPIKK